MTVTFQQPPSSRDFEVYQAVHVERSSTREAAARHKISQTRVRQLVNRVAQWLTVVLPQQADVAKETESRLAQHMTADQLHFVNQELMECWRASHNTKFLGQTIRVSLALARLGVVPGMIGGLMADAEEGLLQSSPLQVVRWGPQRTAARSTLLLKRVNPRPTLSLHKLLRLR